MRKLEKKKEKKMAEMMESPKRESILMGKYYSPRHIHTHRVYRFKEHLLLFPRLLTGRKSIFFFSFSSSLFAPILYLPVIVWLSLLHSNGKILFHINVRLAALPYYITWCFLFSFSPSGFFLFGFFAVSRRVGLVCAFASCSRHQRRRMLIDHEY